MKQHTEAKELYYKKKKHLFYIQTSLVMTNLNEYIFIYLHIQSNLDHFILS